MKVTLINHTANAVDTLLFTKNTRLQMMASNMDRMNDISDAQKLVELEYISNTIKSSWEFIDYTFMIEGVSRAFTHQLVRNRMGSYAQQTMRILDVSGFDYVTGPTIAADEEMCGIYADMMGLIQDTYELLIEKGAAIEDARGILPTNIHTNIVAKYNLRTLSDMMASRSSPRTQGEYREVIEQMYDAVLEVHPWCDDFLMGKKQIAAKKLDSLITNDYEGTKEYLNYIKLIDILRN